MIYWIEAQVEGEIIVSTSFCFRVGSVMFQASADEKGLLTKVAAGTRVSSEQFATRVDLATGETAGTIVIGGDAAISESLVAALQQLESHVSFMTEHSLQRVRWDQPTEVWQAETPEEELLIQVNNVRLEKREEPHVGRVRPDVFAGMAERALALAELTVLTAFWREGSNEFLALRYIQAFYDFYFVIEGRYANGMSSEAEVLRTFKRNRELVEIATKAFDLFRGIVVPDSSLRPLFIEAGCTWNAEGLLRLLIRLRGRLHHFHPGSPKPQPTPFEQQRFRRVAVLAKTMATWAIGYRELEIKAPEHLADPH